MMTENSILPAILSNNTLSTNEFERALQLKQIKEECHKILSAIGTMEVGLYEHLSEIDDENYAVEPVFDSRKTSTLDADLFAQELPDNYANSLYMKTSDIVKLIGKDKLRQIVIDTVGWDVFEENATVSITEARKNIPKPMQDRYIKEDYKQVDYIIVRKNGEK